MKISKHTLNILKNYHSINPSILVKEGNVISTMAITKNILAESTVEESFPVEFALYNVNEFLSAVSLFDNPDFEFSDKFVTIREDGKKRGGLKYFYTNKALIVYPTKTVAIPPEIIDVEFVVTEAMLAKLNKAGAVLGVGDLVVVGDSEGISLIVKDRKNDSSNDFEVQVSDQESKDFEVYYRLENLKLLPGDYKVQLTQKGISMFTSADGTMRVAIALDK